MCWFREGKGTIVEEIGARIKIAEWENQEMLNSWKLVAVNVKITAIMQVIIKKCIKTKSSHRNAIGRERQANKKAEWVTLGKK